MVLHKRTSEKSLGSILEKSFIPYKASATVQAIKVCPVWLSSDWGISLDWYAKGCWWELKPRNSAFQLCINDWSCLRQQGWWLVLLPNCQRKLFWLPGSRPRRTSSFFKKIFVEICTTFWHSRSLYIKWMCIEFESAHNSMMNSNNNFCISNIQCCQVI